MYDTLARRAILAALANDWESALSANLSILENKPEDKDALNRAARASLQIGNITQAIKYSQAVLNVDPLNPIATKFLAKCTTLKSLNGSAKIGNHSLNSMFLEVPGKTKIVPLINICEHSTLAKLSAGEAVEMETRAHKVVVTTTYEVYLGRLPDDLAMRLIYLVKNGNEYTAKIKSVTDSEIKIFIKEESQAKLIAHISSFPVRRSG